MTDSQLLGFDRRDRCPVCGSDHGEVLLDRAFDDVEIAAYLTDFYADALDPSRLSAGRFVLLRCTTCGLVFQRDVLDAVGLDHLYSRVAAGSLDAAQRRRGLPERRTYSFQIEQAIKYFGVEPWKLDVLDFGSGWELWLDMAAAYGCRTTGVEIGHDRVERRPDSSTHRSMSLDELPDDHFHYINSEQVVEHLTDPSGTVRCLVRALQPGGLMRISVPDGGGIAPLLIQPDWSAPKHSPTSLNAVAPLEHVNCFDHAALTTLGTAVAGMEVFRYPLRQSLDRFERLRFAVDGLVQHVRPRRGTAMIFRRPASPSASR